MARPFFECHFQGNTVHRQIQFQIRKHRKRPDLQLKQIQRKTPLFVLVYTSVSRTFSKKIFPQDLESTRKCVYFPAETFRLSIHIVAKNLSSNTLFVCDDLSYSGLSLRKINAKQTNRTNAAFQSFIWLQFKFVLHRN